MQEVEILKTEPELVAALAGEIHSENADEFYAEIAGAYTGKGDIVFECARLEFIDSTTLGTFVKILKLAKTGGFSLRVKGMQPRLKKLFTICALDRIMEIEA